MEQLKNKPLDDGLANPRIAQILMFATYVSGCIGYFIGLMKLGSDGAEAAIRPVALLSVGVVGIISMIRHSVFHRSDAIRMGWDQGRRNNFQIEVGFANLAIGLPAILAVSLGCDDIVSAAFVLAYALYFLQVGVLVLIDRTDGSINIQRLITILIQTGLLGYFSISAIFSA
ncbi:MAG: hypothetical protein P8J89_04235 [Phycisphaerales bacterium]|nr:hypothetical protein [Phycisphaerales bacterium]